jgi:hypothetical protein
LSGRIRSVTRSAPLYRSTGHRPEPDVGARGESGCEIVGARAGAIREVEDGTGMGRRMAASRSFDVAGSGATNARRAAVLA